MKVYGKDELELVRKLSPGDHFGEIALINGCPRSLSVKVKSKNCKVLSLSKANFMSILKSIEKYLKFDYSISHNGS